MKTITVKTDDALFERIDRLAKRLHMTKSELIRRSIVEYESILRKRALKERMREASLRVRQESRKMAEAFDETLEDGLTDV
ncbi:CopG family ribbon-helix-helix protein [Hydrogenimonas sp.]